MDENKGVRDEPLSQFKIVSFENLEDEEIETGNYYVCVIYF
jgi:hypothetical protein